MLNRRPPAAFLHGRTTRRVFTKGVVAALLTPVLASPLLLQSPAARAAALTTRGVPGEVPVHPQLINLTDGYGIFGRGWDDALWYRGYGQDEWQWVGGNLTSAPAATSWGNLQMSVFVRDSNDRLATIATTDAGESWGPWVNLGGSLASAPAVTAWAQGRLDVFAVAADSSLQHTWYDNGRWWPGWENLGGSITADPAVASWGQGRLDVFVRGTDNALWHKWYDTDSWSGWESLGGVLNSGPAAVSAGQQSWTVFVRNTDNLLSYRTYTNGSLSAWVNLLPNVMAFPSSSAPAVATSIDQYYGIGRLFVYYRGPDGSVLGNFAYVPSLDAPPAIYSWVYGPTWYNMGGYLTSAPGATMY